MASKLTDSDEAHSNPRYSKDSNPLLFLEAHPDKYGLQLANEVSVNILDICFTVPIIVQRLAKIFAARTYTMPDFSDEIGEATVAWDFASVSFLHYVGRYVPTYKSSSWYDHYRNAFAITPRTCKFKQTEMLNMDLTGWCHASFAYCFEHSEKNIWKVFAL